MLRLNTISFKDDETGKIIEVRIEDWRAVSVAGLMTPDEYVTALLHSKYLISGGFEKSLNQQESS